MKDNCRMTASLEARNLTKAYRNGGEELIVLEDVTLRIQAGETCAIIGPSGSGKSTLLGLCAGLDQPTRGEVFIEGTRITGMSEDALAQLRNQRLGFVFQSFQLLQNLTSLENVMVPLELRGDRSAQTRARALLERVGLRERLTHYPTQLSGGEQQRVALARAFINQPRILFADEPTGNLDGATSATVVDLMFEMNRELGTALVLITHDPALARRCDRTVAMADGRIVPAEHAAAAD